MANAFPAATRSATHTGTRVTLLVGLSAHETTGRLTNPVNDARIGDTALRELGFETILSTCG